MTFSTKMRVARFVLFGYLVAISSAVPITRNMKFDEVPQCRTYYYGLLPYPPNCKLYVRCINGIALVESCWDGYVFDGSKLDCVKEAALKSCEDGGFIAFTVGHLTLH